MRFWKLVGTALALACVAPTQNLAPDVLLLARIKSHIREELSHLPDYTCLETTVRFRKEPGGRFQPKVQPKLPLDTVRLEIVYSDHHEWYASPGDRSFTEDDPVGFIGSGMIGNGAFAITLNNIFRTDGATFTYRGEQTVGGRPAALYDFRWPRLMGGFTISMIGGVGTVGQEGSFLVDPQSLDLIRMESRAAEIPPFLPLVGTTLDVTYARTRIGEYNVLLAQQADLHLIKTNGEESYNRSEFTHCRAFAAHSAIRFDPEAEDAAEPRPSDRPKAPSPVSGASEAVPAFLPVTLLLTTPITEKDAVGTLIQAKVSGDVVRKGEIVIPNGSLVRGRIRRLERYSRDSDTLLRSVVLYNKADFIVGLEFTEIDVNGGSLRFYADFLRMDRGPGIRPTLSELVAVRSHVGSGDNVREWSETITLPKLPGVASFFVRGMTFTVPSGFRMVWRTRGPIR